MLGTRSYDQDFDTSDKSLVTSIQKAINSMEAPVKEKHARVIVIASHKDKTTANYWNLTRRMPLQENAIMAWKFCHVSHKLLRDGYKSAIKESQGSMVLIGELGKLWGHLKEGYGGLIAVYCRLLLQKISFHRKNPQMPGNLVLEDEAFNKMYQHSVDEYFELSVDLLDYLDCILNLQLIVFSTLDHSRCNSMMSNGQCMLAPLLPCVLDSVQLYHYLVHILFKLHSALPASTLQGHRERFTKQYNLLKEFFRKVSSMQYFKNLATVPPLPQSLPDFLKAYELSSHVRPEVVIKDEDEAKNVIPAKDVEEELARLRVVLREKEGMLERAEKEVQEKDKELQRVHDEDLAVLNSMRCKVVELEAEADIQRQISQSTTQENELLKNMLNEKSNLESGKSALEEAVRSSEEKFTKMKDIYSKLRQEHVMTLKKFSDVTAKAAGMKKEKDELEMQLKETELRRIEREHRLIEDERQKSGIQDDMKNKQMELNIQQSKDHIMFLEKQLNEKVDMIKNLERINENKKVLEERLVEMETCLKAAGEENKVVVAELNEKVRNLKEKMREIDDEKKKLHDRVEANRNDKKVIEEKINKIYRSLQESSCATIKTSLQLCAHKFPWAVKCSPDYSMEKVEESKRHLEEFQQCLSLHLKQKTGVDLLLSPYQALSHCLAETMCLSSASCVDSAMDIPIAAQLLMQQLVEHTTMLFHASDEDMLNQQTSKVKECLNKIAARIEEYLSKEENKGDTMEEEMKNATVIVQKAAEQLAELLKSSRQKHSGVHLEVSVSIIDSCDKLMSCIRALIEASKVLQQEIINKAGAHTPAEFYKKHHRWTDGLISAAKAVGVGAKTLLAAADKVVCKKGKFEELVVCAQEIASSTAQLVVASRVKADRHSKNLQHLAEASKAVSEATGLVVGAAKSGAEKIDEQEIYDFCQLSLHNAKRYEMESQVRVLELESGLEKERRKLAELRKKHYQLAAEVQMAEEDNI